MKTNARALLATLALLATCAADEPAATNAALTAAGDNSAELTRALREAPPEQRDAMSFLIQNMPPADLAFMKAGFLLAHVAEAYRDLAAAPWATKIPDDIFLNEILPYASLNERRDSDRAAMREICAPIVKDSRTPAEAAQLLNRTLFKKLNVRYSTKRNQADQSAAESIASGLASCSGLSILLVEACRSVGIPARVIGTPMWTNLRGNHTWVEIWDGDWHFTGAAEPDANGLDRGWFKGDAAKADDTKPEHRIYASSFRKTGIAFPLVWAPGIDWVPAVNVTARYTAAAKPDEGKTKLLIRVLDKPAGKRIAAPVTLTDTDSGKMLIGTSTGETADQNNLLTFTLPPGQHYRIEATLGNKTATAQITIEKKPEQTITLHLAE